MAVFCSPLYPLCIPQWSPFFFSLKRNRLPTNDSRPQRCCNSSETPRISKRHQTSFWSGSSKSRRGAHPKGIWKSGQFGPDLTFDFYFFRKKMPIFFYAEAKLGSCIVENKDFSFFSCWKSKVGDVRKKISAFKNVATVLILGHIQVPIVRKTTI